MRTADYQVHGAKGAKKKKKKIRKETIVLFLVDLFTRDFRL
jgi:hypothetical protein